MFHATPKNISFTLRPPELCRKKTGQNSAETNDHPQFAVKRPLQDLRGNMHELDLTSQRPHRPAKNFFEIRRKGLIPGHQMLNMRSTLKRLQVLSVHIYVSVFTLDAMRIISKRALKYNTATAFGK